MIRSLENGQRPALIVNECQVGILDPRHALFPGLAMAATDLGYHVVVPEDCIAGGDPDAHRVIVDHQLRMLATLTTKDQVIAALG